VLADLIIPKADGSGVLGGLDLIRQIRTAAPDLSMIAMSDFHHAESVAELSAIGCPYLAKPRRGDTKGEPFARFMEELRAVLQKSCSIIETFFLEGQEQ